MDLGGKRQWLPPIGVIAWLAVTWWGPLINDVGWQLWIGRQLNGGAVLYRDILEVNPPLWFWLGALVERVAGWMGLSGPRVLLLMFASLALVAMFLVGRVAANTRERMIVNGGLVATLLLTSSYAHLQREQFLVVTMWPLIALYARRAEGARVGVATAVAIGLLAAPGLALKHYFLLLVIALELWLWWRRRTRSIRPELVALAVAGLAYGAAVLTVTPGYLSEMLPLLRLTYEGFDPPLGALLSQAGLVVALIALVAALLRRRVLSPMASAAAIATAALILAFVVQSKNFEYQVIPALSAGVVCAALLVWGRREQDPREGRIAAIAALLGALAVPFLAGSARYDDEFAQATARLPRGAGVTLISPSAATAWPLVYEREYRWSARQMSGWMLLAPWFSQGEADANPKVVAVGVAARREIAAEIACSRPAMVLIDRRYDETTPGGDLLAWFRRDERAVAALASYVERSPVAYLRVFERTGNAAPVCDLRDLRAVNAGLAQSPS